MTLGLSRAIFKFFSQLGLQGQAFRRAVSRLSLPLFLLFFALPSAHGQASPIPSSAVPGSVPSGPATAEVVKLTLRDAVNMALRYNLGQIESQENVRTARGQRLQALSLLLPQVNAGVTENVEQATTAPLGIKTPFI